MERICKKISTILVLLFFAGAGILSTVLKDKEYSEEENRYLAKAPKLSVQNVLSGDYQKQIEPYLSDQFVGRKEFMNIYGLGQTLLGKTDYNGVYLCDNHRFIEKYIKPVNTDNILKRFNDFTNKYDLNCTLMLVPTAISIYSEELPRFAGMNNSQREVYDYIYSQVNMEIVDTWSTLEKNKDRVNLYYKTDHHWTTEAAYLAYVSYCERLDISPKPEDFFDITTVSDSFYGTIMSKVLSPAAKPDSITCYKQDMTGIKVTYPSGEGNLYSEDYLKKKDKYSYFLNGINPVIVIDNENIKEENTLLVVKDSYANCFIPFLINHYKKIVVLDTRYYRSGAGYASEEYGATDVLFLFNLNTLDTEAALNGIY